MSSNPDNRSTVEQAAATDDSILQVHNQLRAQKPDREEGFSKTPLILLGIMCTAVFFGSIYVAHFSIRFDPLVVSENASRIAPDKPTGPVITPFIRGKIVYQRTCVICHQQNGMGQAGVYPPLVNSEWVSGSEERSIRIVLHGLNGPIMVAGKEYNNVMAPLGTTLSDQQVADVLSYIRQEWGNTGPDVTADSVAQVRAATADRKAPWTADELLQMGN